MSAQIIDGKAIAQDLRREVRAGVDSLRARGRRTPGLAVVMVGDNPASQVYVRNKRLACEDCCIRSMLHALPQSTTEIELLTLIDALNADADVDGILVQLPLPDHIRQTIVVERIDPRKDVDGFHPYNIGRLAGRNPLIRPCTPYGVIRMLERVGVNVQGQHCVVVGGRHHNRHASLYAGAGAARTTGRRVDRCGWQAEVHSRRVDTPRCCRC